MPRIDLAVPFAEKDYAKRLGAHWDPARKVWYVPDSVDALAFWQWLPGADGLNVRSNSYCVAKAIAPCWKCQQETPVYGFVLPTGHENLESPEDETLPDFWLRSDEPGIPMYVTDLLPSVAARIATFSRHYRTDFSSLAESSYLMNHCAHCGIKQGDFRLHCTPPIAFFPMDERAASKIELHAFHEPFGCSGGVSYGNPFIGYMRRV
jgi:hypothetical protein